MRVSLVIWKKRPLNAVPLAADVAVIEPDTLSVLLQLNVNASAPVRVAPVPTPIVVQAEARQAANTSVLALWNVLLMVMYPSCSCRRDCRSLRATVCNSSFQ
jgi:hypothetical protein